MRRVVEVRIYPTILQQQVLRDWMRTCCWLHNQALEQRIKAWGRRKQRIRTFDQFKWHSDMRSRIPRLASVPSAFARDAIRRVDSAFEHFFRRCKNGSTPGFPKFKSWKMYRSMEFLNKGKYFRDGRYISIPKIGHCQKVIRGLIMTVKESDHCDKHRKSLSVVWSGIKEFLRGQNG